MREAENIAVVERFLADITRQTDLDAVMAYLTDDVVYHNIPTAPFRGRDAVRAAFERMYASIEAVPWQVLHIAATGNVVLTERVDPITVRGGQHVDLPVMGAFELRDGKIAAWRDYWDRQTLQRGLTGGAAASTATA